MQMKNTELILTGLTIAFICFVLGYFSGQNSAKGTFSVKTEAESTLLNIENRLSADSEKTEENLLNAASATGSMETSPAETAANKNNQETKDVSPININAADLNALMELPGIGETLAGRIIDFRNSSGSFKKTEDIMLVKGIGEKTYEKIKDMISVG